MFTTLALVGMLIVPLNAFPWVLNGVLEAKVSLGRIQGFFKLTNQDLRAHYGVGTAGPSPPALTTRVHEMSSEVHMFSTSAPVSPEDGETAILLSQGTFSWQGPGGPPPDKEGGATGSLLLQGLTLHVAKVQRRLASLDRRVLFESQNSHRTQHSIGI